MAKHKKDLLLIAVVLIIAAVGFGMNYLIQKAPAAQLEISVDGEVLTIVDLDKNTELDIEGWNGGSNHLVIQDGMAWVNNASCPDKVCVHQGKIALNRQMIVCLPNRMTATILAPGQE